MPMQQLRDFLAWKVPSIHEAERIHGAARIGTVSEVSHAPSAHIRTKNRSFTSAVYPDVTLGVIRVWYSYSVPIRYAMEPTYKTMRVVIRDTEQYSATTARHQWTLSGHPAHSYVIDYEGDISQPLHPVTIVQQHHDNYVEYVKKALRAHTNMRHHLVWGLQCRNDAVILAEKAGVEYRSLHPLELAAEQLGEKAHAKLLGKMMTDEHVAHALNSWNH